MKKYILLFFILSFVLFPNTINAASTNKNSFPFEITNISIDEHEITIHGWGMVVNKHHYDSVNSHCYELVLNSSNHKLSYYSKPIQLSQTEIMKYLGIRKCGQNEYFKKGTTCYYNYDYVGFEFKIPLKDLNIDEIYDSKLIIHSNILGFSEETYVFYPILTPLIQINNHIQYEIISNLYDTSLIIADFAVFEREEPIKNSKIRQSNSICNPQHGYYRYFDKGSVYNYVFDRKVADNTTFYKVKTNINTVCKLGRNVTSEGSDYESWIAGNWADFDGEPMKISIKDINEAPTINILNHPIIKLDDIYNFDFKNYIQSLDKEDGDITNKTIILNKSDLSSLGTYKLELEVEDSCGKKAHNTLIVKVIEGNNAPIIYANDMTIYQYEKFNYLDNVSANDKEDGDLTNKIKYNGFVNTNELGTYKVQYYVVDSKNKFTSKTINVNVIRNPKEKIRFISTHDKLIFYKIDIPLNWKDNIEYLKEQINHPKVFNTNKFILK